MPSLAHMYANTIATSAPFAAAAAAAGSVPGSYFTVACGARAWIAFNGEVGNQISSIQCVGALSRRLDGVSADRIDLRRAAARNHAHIRVRSDHRDRLQFRGAQRQHCLLILQQNDSAFFNLARRLKSGKWIDDGPLPWMIDYAVCEHRCAECGARARPVRVCGILPASSASLNRFS